jgi:hypothetical protein
MPSDLSIVGPKCEHDPRDFILRRALTCCVWLLGSVATAQLLDVARPARADELPTDVLVIGDSQITFGSGLPLLSFFEMINKSCQDFWPAGYERLLPDRPSVGIIGVRSTSLGAWVSRTDRGKSPICDEDPKWHANAGSYGVLNDAENPYIQIGQGEEYAFCESGKSAFEAMFAEGYYAPRLLVLSFLGNEAELWANNPDAALKEVRSTMDQLPPDLPCIFMTTPPAFGQDTATLRGHAQDNIIAAFDLAGSRCSIVPGHTAETLALNVGNAEHFRRRGSGTVRDPYHPTREAQEAAVGVLSSAICTAVAEQLRSTGGASDGRP